MSCSERHWRVATRVRQDLGSLSTCASPVPPLTEAAMWQLLRSTVLRPKKPNRRSAALSISPNVTWLPEERDDLEADRLGADPRRWSWDGDEGWNRLQVVLACLWKPDEVWSALTGSAEQKKLPGKADRIAKILVSNPALMDWSYKDLGAVLRTEHNISATDRTISRARQLAKEMMLAK